MAETREQLLQRMRALEQPTPQAAPAPRTGATADQAQLLERMRALEQAPEKVTIDVVKEAPPGSPQGASFLSWMPGFEFMGALSPEQQQKVAQEVPQLAKQAAATGISTAASVGGALAGGAVAGPAGAVVGETLGSGAAREVNKQLGLEPKNDPLSDVMAWGGPLASAAGRYAGRVLKGAPPKAVPLDRTAPVPEAPQDVLAAGVSHAVPVGYADMPGATTAKKVATVLENVPVLGTTGFRKRQQAATKQAAGAVQQAQQQAMEQVPYQDLARVEAAATRGDAGAQQLLTDIANAGEDWSKVVQASGNLRAWRARQAASTLYDRAEQLAQGMGDVPLTSTTKALDDAITTLESAKIPDTPTLNLLTNLREQLGGGNPFPVIRQLRSDVGDLVRDYYKGTNAVVGAKGVGILQQVKTAVERDLSDFASQSGNPQLKTAYQRADRFYKEQVVPYKDQGLAKALSTDTPDEIYRQFVQRGKGDRAEKFYKALDPKGRAAVRMGMVEEAMDKASDPTTEVFSPAKFAKSLDDVKEAYGVFFRGHDKWEMDGFAKLMRHVQRAGQYTENPPTGLRNFLPMAGAGAGYAAAMSLGTAGAGAAATKGLSWLLTSPTGRRLLLAAADATPGSATMERLAGQIAREGSRVLSEEDESPPQ